MPSVELSSCYSCYVFRQSFAVKRVKCSAILYSLPKQLKLVPMLLLQLFNNLSICYTLDVISSIWQNFPNLVDNSWLWWIMPGILANQKRRNILNEKYNRFCFMQGDSFLSHGKQASVGKCNNCLVPSLSLTRFGEYLSHHPPLALLACFFWFLLSLKLVLPALSLGEVCGGGRYNNTIQCIEIKLIKCWRETGTKQKAPSIKPSNFFHCIPHPYSFTTMITSYTLWPLKAVLCYCEKHII